MEPETYQHPKQPHPEKPLVVYPTESDANPPKNAAYWKRRAMALESQVKEMQNDMAMIARLLEKEGFEGGSIIDHIVGTIYCHLKP